MAVKFANNAKSTLNGAHNDSTTTIAVVDGSVFPTLSGADYFYMTLEDVSLNREIVKVTARSGNNLTVVRAQDGTTARSFSTADKAELRITVAGLTDIMALASDAIAALSSVYQALDADLTSWAGVTRASGFDTFTATPSSANLRSLVTDETGTGSLVFGTSPTLVTPALGTPSALVLTNATGLPNSSVIGLGTAALVNTGTSGATIPLLNGANTWSGAQTITDLLYSRTAFAALGILSTNDSSGIGMRFANSGATADLLYVQTTSNSFGAVVNALTIVPSTGVWNFLVAPVFNGVAIPTISSTDTLSNKTLASPTISGTVAGAVTTSGVWTFNSNPVIYGADPYSYWCESDSPSNEKLWRMGAGGSDFYFQTLTDDYSTAATIFSVHRTGMTVDTVNFTPTNLQHNAVAIPTISSTDTLSNKTLASPTLSGTVAGNATYSGSANFTYSAGNYGLSVTNTANNELVALYGGSGYNVVSYFASGTRKAYIGLNSASFDLMNEHSGGAINLQTTGGGALQFNGVAVPTISSTSTLSNKTLSSPTLSGTVSGAPTWANDQVFPTVTATIVYAGGSTPSMQLLGTSSSGLINSSNYPYFDMRDEDGGTNAKYWRLDAGGNNFTWYAVNDAFTVFNPWLSVVRSAAVVTNVVLTATSAITLTTPGVYLSGSLDATEKLAVSSSTFPNIVVHNSGSPSNAKYWRHYVSGSSYVIDLINDAYSAANAGLEMTRSGSTAAGLFWGGVAVPTISSTDTLSNKTLASPTLSGTVAGAAAWSGKQDFGDYSSGPKFTNPYWSWKNAAGTRIGYMQFYDAGGINIVPEAGGVLLFNGVTVDTVSSTATLTNKTLSSPTLSGTVAGSPSFSGNVSILSDFRFYEAGAGTNEKYWQHVHSAGVYLFRMVNDAFNDVGPIFTIDRTGYSAATFDFGSGITLTRNSVAIPTISSTDTLSNKTIASPTLSGTVAGTPTISSAWTWSSAQQFPTVELGHASDTTVSRLAAGQVGVEGKAVIQHAGSYTSGQTTFSTSDPSGGSDGDIWYKHAA